VVLRPHGERRKTRSNDALCGPARMELCPPEKRKGPAKLSRGRKRGRGSFPCRFLTRVIEIHETSLHDAETAVGISAGWLYWKDDLSNWPRRPDDAPKRRMPKLSSESRRLARRVVQERRAIALSRAGGTGLPVMSAACRISTRKDRAGTAGSALGEAACGPGSGVGRNSGCLCRRNAARLYICRRSWGPVRELLDSARGPASRCQRTRKTTGAVK
jgi:hypothetical protein